MNDKQKKLIFSLIVAIAIVILIGVGSTFAYFSAAVSSEENAVSMGAAVYKLSLIDDTSLIKSQIIPSAEKYVDLATIPRVDENGDFIKPYEKDGQLITDKTVCIDDNLNEICSVYTFTIQNTMTDMDLPLYITLVPSVNTFDNLYYKVLDDKQNVVIEATHLVDDREYELGPNGEKIYEEGSRMSPAVLTNINKTLPKAVDKDTPSEVTYSIVMWVMETGKDQTKLDGGQIYAGTLNVNASGADGYGITGVFTATGVE